MGMTVRMRSSLHEVCEWYEEAQLQQWRGVEEREGGAQLRWPAAPQT